MCAKAILHTLTDSGPADVREINDTLASTGPVSREHVCLELHNLIRAGLVSVSCGLYSAVAP